MKPEVVIVVAAHKPYRMPKDGMYLPLHVGCEGKATIGYQGDNTGENISLKNGSFCELTGLYWAWKNLDADYIGLVHYRRYLCENKIGRDPFENILKQEQATRILQHHSVIVPKKRRYYIETLYSHYAHTFYAEHLDATREIVAEKTLDYLDDFDRVMKRTWGYMFNMMVMRRELFQSYCSWLFPILFELEKRNVTPGLEGFHARFYGRVSERLFNVWLARQVRVGNIRQEEIQELPWVYMEKIQWVKKIQGFILAKIFHRKYKASF